MPTEPPTDIAAIRALPVRSRTSQVDATAMRSVRLDIHAGQLGIASVSAHPDHDISTIVRRAANDPTVSSCVAAPLRLL